jgi:hypothetical protein
MAENGPKVSKRHVPNTDPKRDVRCPSCGNRWRTSKMFEKCPPCVDLEAQVG